MKYDVILQPVVTEKATGERSLENKFVFQVAPNANKIEVARAFFQMFGVKPTSVNITKVVSKVRPRTGAIKRPSVKRAIVSVSEGSKVDLAAIK